MKDKKQFQLKNRHLLAILTIFCIAAIALTVTKTVNIAPVRQVASVLIIPFQKGINKVGSFLDIKKTGMETREALEEEVQNLQTQVNTLIEENTILTQNEEELERLRKLYQLDLEYSAYDKIGAQVISKDPGNWYSSFTINRGTDDGIAVDMNVISDGGLVGIITEVGGDWATVRSIIDDQSNVSAMTVSTMDTCIVSGDLRLLEEGKLAFGQLHTDKEITPGEKIVTSNVSDKYLKGILIGYVDSIMEDSNHLTKTGFIVPVVDFQHLSEVLVIKELKATGGN